MLSSEEIVIKAHEVYSAERINDLSNAAADSVMHSQRSVYEQSLDKRGWCAAFIPPIGIGIAALVMQSTMLGVGIIVSLYITLAVALIWAMNITPRMAQQKFPLLIADKPLPITLSTQLDTNNHSTLITTASVGEDTTIIETISVALHDDTTIALAGRIKTRDEAAQIHLQQGHTAVDNRQLEQHTQQIAHNTEIVTSILARDTHQLTATISATISATTY